MKPSVAAVVLLALVTVAFVGCVTQPKVAPAPAEAAFYPLPPDPPRIQFLTSISTSQDVGAKKKSGFAQFILGEEEEPVHGPYKPYGIAMHDGKIYVCDTKALVIDVFDLKNSSFYYFGNSGQGKLRKPINIFIDPATGEKYVADPVRQQVVVFGPDDNYVRAYGTAFESKAVDVAVWEGEVFVVDVGSHQIDVYDKVSGNLLRRIGERGPEPGHFNFPSNIAIDAEGNLYVSDSFNFRIQKLDRNGNVLKVIGEVGDAPGTFTRARGLAVDRDGILYVVDAAFELVQLFNKDGRCLMWFPSGGEDPGALVLPADIYINYDDHALFQKYVSADFQVDYIVLVSSQYGNRLVNVYGFGHKAGMTPPGPFEAVPAVSFPAKEKKEPPAPEKEKLFYETTAEPPG